MVCKPCRSSLLTHSYPHEYVAVGIPVLAPPGCVVEPKNDQQLAAVVRTEGKVLGKDFAVVDVRGEDYAGGHIKGAIHQSSKTLPHGGVEEIREKTKNIPTVIFHCLLSQVRFVFLKLSARLALTIWDQGPGICQGMLAIH